MTERLSAAEIKNALGTLDGWNMVEERDAIQKSSNLRISIRPSPL